MKQLALYVRSVCGGKYRALALVVMLAVMGGIAVAAPLPSRARIRRPVTATPDFSRPMRRSKEHETAKRKTQRPVIEARSERAGSRAVRGRSRARDVVAKRTEPLVTSRSRRGLQAREQRGVEQARVVKQEHEAREAQTRKALEAALERRPAVAASREAADGALSGESRVKGSATRTFAAKEEGGYATGVSTPDEDEPETVREVSQPVRGVKTEGSHEEDEVASADADASDDTESRGASAAPVRMGVAAPAAGKVLPTVSAKGAPTAATEDVLRAERSPGMDVLTRPSRQELAEEAVAPRLPGLYSREGKLIMPAPLKGSREILVHQNEMADAAGLNRILNDAELDRLRLHRQLVDFPESSALHVNPQLPQDRRCARPWTVRFAEDTSRAFYARFHEPLQLNSAVRTVSYQRRLERVNGNAAATTGEAASPHLTGQALDFGKRGMSLEELAWMRAYLLPLMQSGKLDVEEEFQQACFHISVYKSYERKKDDAGEVAELR